MKMAEWRDARNRQSLARLNKALPAIFPVAVLQRALTRRFIPPTPRLAVDGYWRAHPLRADRLARALAARSDVPAGWSWRLRETKSDGVKSDGLPATFRAPPAPFREARFSRGPGHCCICGQPVYKFGWHCDLWGAGPNRNATWHSACVVAWQFWAAPSDHALLLRRLQGRRCASGGSRLWKTAEVDHHVPLYRVWQEMRDTPWPTLLNYWGMPNLQIINRDRHVEKCADEAGHRAQARARAAAAIAVSVLTSTAG